MGVVPPMPGFNRALVELAHANGALVITDEVLTGFRVSAAGWWGLEHGTAGAYTPDLLTFGKVIGGGMPVAALGGRAEIMEQLAPLGPVYQAGTLSGNPVAVAAGVATLKAADAAVYARLDATAATISAAVSDALAAEGVAHARAARRQPVQLRVRRRGRGAAVRDYAAVQRQESWRYPPFFHAMLDAGVSLPPSVFEAWFVTAAHDDAAIGRIVDALPAAARAAASARPADSRGRSRLPAHVTRRKPARFRYVIVGWRHGEPTPARAGWNVWPSFACTTTGSRFTSPRPRRRSRCAATTSWCSATTSARRPSPTTRGSGSAASAGAAPRCRSWSPSACGSTTAAATSSSSRASGQAVVLELADGEFTRIILSTNHAAKLIDRLKLPVELDESDAQPSAD